MTGLGRTTLNHVQKPLDASADQTLSALIASYESSGAPIEVNFRGLIAGPRPSIRSVHLLHPYPAKLLPNIPNFFLGAGLISDESSVVADPFCGSGTVLLEAQVRGFSVSGADSNPLARLITSAKLSWVDIELARRELAQIIAACDDIAPLKPDVVNRDFWFSRRISQQLGRLRAAILSCVGEVHRPLFDVCFSAVVRRVSYADPRLSVPVRLNAKRASVYGAKGDLALKRLKSLRKVDVRQLFWSVTARAINGHAELQSAYPERNRNYSVGTDARRLELSDSSVDLIITSPPYVGAQKYIRASSLSLGWLGHTPGSALRPLEKQSIGREHLGTEEPLLPSSGLCAADNIISEVHGDNALRARIAQRYLIEMRDAIEEMARVLRPRGHAVLVVGPNLVAGRVFDTPSYLKALAVDAGLDVKLHLRDTITSRGLTSDKDGRPFDAAFPQCR